ncbi:MAG TPA: acyl-CoA dehydrogenase family protein [Nocardioides sp.]|uniref:acyl-CoA dehydrogenase family protein n=1 Tax=Nocardioides sp. TaxID=35761 RepID=UPI002C418F1D|nr:acyl-CoA dehydrogenase family protein [Nocardioides sp.]HTW18441.1 acyl-CoA dehydrogenase family protein [Nocardioides sp.]
MDFNLDEDQLAVAELARTILDDRATTDRVRAVEATPSRVDDDLWHELGKAGLLGLALPEADGGAGLGLAALAVVLEEQGRHVAPVPLWSHAVAARAVAGHGDDALRAELLPGAADGSTRLTLALEEYDARPPARPTCRADRDGDGWRLSGVKAAVPSYAGADHVLVSATGPDGPALFVLPREGAGTTWRASVTSSHDIAGELVLDGAAARFVGGTDALADTLRAAAVALAALQVGVAEGALRLAASYTSGREQFGRPLATFQSLQHQLADCWIDIDAMRVTLWQAVQAVDGDGSGIGLDRAVQVASWWRVQAGLDVVHRVQHVHGGIGVDVDYPVHRHFLWGRQLAGTLGSPASVLADLGARLAVEEVVS